MEILVLVVIVVGVVAMILSFGQASLDKPLSEWSDEELVRRLPKYTNLLSAQVKASEWDKTKVTQGKIDDIHAEIVKRQKAFEAQQAAPLKRDSVFSDKPDVVIAPKAFVQADAGDVDVQVLLGSAFMSGSNGLPQNLHKARHYFTMAAEQGHGFASFMLAGFFLEGMGVTPNIDQAHSWASKAKARGFADADQMLAAIDAKRSAL